MSDVFISKARSTSAQAHAAAKALRALGYSVWLDDELPTHRTYSDVIEEELASAKALLVIWSAEAVKSQWVKSEADRARNANKLVQMSIDGARLPMPFDQIQCAELPGWAGDTAAPGWNKVLASLAALVGAASAAPAPVAVGTHDPLHHPSRRVFSIAAAAIVVVALMIALWWRNDSKLAQVPTAQESIAVLPFVAMSEDENLRHLGEGIAEEFTNQLAGQPNLEVASRTSAFQPHEGLDAVAIAHTLGVAYVLEGSVRPSGDLIRLTTQLIRAADGYHIWSETYDLPGSAMEQDETIRVASLMVGAQMDLDRDLRDAQKETTNDEAFQYYAAAARMRRLMNRGGSTATWEPILAKVDKAIALDPDFAPALRLRANAYLNRLGVTVRWEVAAREARRSIDHALVQHPEKPELLGQLALIQATLELDLTAAQQTLERIRAIDPDLVLLNEMSAGLAMRRGHVRDALRYWQQAIERDPYNIDARTTYGFMLYFLGDLPGAERAFDEALRLAPRGRTKIVGTVGRILISIQRGELEKAKAEFEPLWSEFQHTPRGALGFLLARLGHEQEARALVSELSSDSNADPNFIFWLYYGLKEYEHALEWLRRGIDDRDSNIISLVRLPNVYPEIQDMPGFAAVLAHLDSLQRSP